MEMLDHWSPPSDNSSTDVIFSMFCRPAYGMNTDMGATTVDGNMAPNE